MRTINISKEFTDKPGYRCRNDGPFSGEEFREEFLEPLFETSSAMEKVRINLDGGYGYSTSFLEEAFGGIVRKHGAVCLDLFEFISDEEPDLIDEIRDYMEKAAKGKE